ncbi:unnamed protein product [Chilo suppressalis]|nr:unnamed protein product [Chilo suppressalis]
MVFYAVLTLMFAACMGGLFLTLDPKTPSYTMSKSLIGINPGVAARPHPNSGLANIYDAANETAINKIVEKLDEFLQPYQKAKLITSEDCTRNEKFGYPNTPCFFIKLNKIIGWIPECYNDADNLPADMPNDLQDYIRSQSPMLNQIWVSCWQEKQNNTEIEYPWSRGLPADKYPFMNDEGYFSPLVAVKVTPPVNELVYIRCRVWAKNVIYNKSMKEPSGYIRIQLLVQDARTTIKTSTEK